MKGKSESIITFDFSTLGTKALHNKLLKVMHELTDFCLDKASNKKKLQIIFYIAALF